MSGEQYYPEIMAPGVGLLDYDNDGDLDVYLTQGAMLGAGEDAEGRHVSADRGRSAIGSFATISHVGADGTRTLRFTDVTGQSGIDMTSYGMGVAAGDIDNDGWVDIYRTGLSRRGAAAQQRQRHVHRHHGEGRRRQSAAAGACRRHSSTTTATAGWISSSATICSTASPATSTACRVTGQHDYCPPNSYRAQPDRLYHNRGNGTFEDVTSRALIGGADGPALGVSTADFNGDGWIDIYVGNDGQPNQLWINQKNGTFKDTAFLSGAAVNGQGNSEASMGIDAGDFDNDGDEDIFITNWLAQMNILYVNMGGGVFEDRKAASGLGPPSLAKTGFGAAWFDYDNDSWLDLLTANGSVSIIEAQARVNDPFPLKMLNQLYRNLGNGRFEDVSSTCGAGVHAERRQPRRGVRRHRQRRRRGRRHRHGRGPARLLINNIGNKNHWLGASAWLARRPEARRDRSARASRSCGRRRSTLWRRARSDGSYASANDPRVLVGLGTSTDPVRVRVQLAERQDARNSARSPIDRWTTLTEGTGK